LCLKLSNTDFKIHGELSNKGWANENRVKNVMFLKNAAGDSLVDLKAKKLLNLDLNYLVFGFEYLRKNGILMNLKRTFILKKYFNRNSNKTLTGISLAHAISCK